MVKQKQRHVRKRALMTQGKNLLMRTLRKSLLLEILKRILSQRNLKRTLSMRVLRGFKTFNEFYTAKNFFILVMVYGRVGDGDKFSYENFGLESNHFHAKKFFS